MKSLIGIRGQIKNLSFYLLATILTSLMGVLINPLLAINLSPEDYAILGYYSSFNIPILSIISFSLVAYYSRNFFLIREDERQEVLDSLIVAQLVIGFILLVAVSIGFFFYMKVADVKIPFFPYALLSFIPIYFSCYYNILLVEKRMQREAISYFKIVMIHSFISVSFAILLVVVLKMGVIGRLWSFLIPAVGIGIYSFFNLISKFRFRRDIIRRAIQFGWPISVSSILFYFMTGVDRAMLEQLNETTNFGIYNVGVQISAYINIFYTAIFQTFQPDIFKSIAENDRRKLFIIAGGIVLFTAIPTLLFVLFAYPVVDILSHGRYTDSTIFAQITAVKHIPMALALLVSNIIIGYGYPKVELVNRAIGAILSTIMFRILINRFGFYGAAWGHSVAFVLMTLVSASFIIYKVTRSRKL